MKQQAINLIKPYVERGDTYDELRKSFLGICANGLSCKITNHHNDKRLSKPIILVSQNGKEEIFKLEDIFNEILGVDKLK
jgi:hypothetical protein